MAEKKYKLTKAAHDILILKENTFVAAQRELETAVSMALASAGCPEGTKLLRIDSDDMVVELP